MSNIKVEKPIFIFGSPGSGTTLLYETLCNHKDLAYITLNILRTRIYKHSSPFITNSLLKIYNSMHKDDASTRPHEANAFWIKYFGTYEYLTENNYVPEMASYYKRNILMVQNMNKRNRLVNKNLQHCVRVRLLHKLFPDAKFIHIIRDGRAVAFSILNKARGSNPPTMFLLSLQKILGNNYQPQRSQLFNYGLACGELVKKAKEASVFGSDSYYEIYYEDLISRPHEEIKKIIKFCELDLYSVFEKEIPHTINMNVKWKQDATDDQRSDLEESTQDTRQILGIN